MRADDGYTYEVWEERNGKGRVRYAIYRHIPQSIPHNRLHGSWPSKEGAVSEMQRIVERINQAKVSEYHPIKTVAT